tara:strand:- start:1646 stop:1768 length:123 start_codon:yes stop_codon:yes gene_type:complete
MKDSQGDLRVGRILTGSLAADRLSFYVDVILGPFLGVLLG